MISTVFRIAGTAGAVVGASYFGRSWIDGIVGKDDRDTSDISVNIRRRLPNKIKLEYKTENGEIKIGVLDSHLYSKEINNQILAFESKRENLKDMATTTLAEELKEPFESTCLRINRFADWYFSYTTGYAILTRIITSTASNTISLTRSKSISEEVQKDIEKYIENQYKHLVLRPEMLDPILSRAFISSLEASHKEYMSVVSLCDRKLQSIIESNSPHVFEQQTMSIILDWSAQASKAQHLKSTFEKSPEASVGLVAGGTIVGKAFGSMAVSKGAAGGLASKLASPFITAAGSGGISGLMLGPGGAIVGAGVGVGIDMLLNKGTELLSRSNFEKDVQETVYSAKEEWFNRTQKELHRAIDVWIDDSVQSLQFENKLTSS